MFENAYKFSETELMNKLRPYLNEYRYRHSLGVMETADKLSKHYGENSVRARIAGLLHDVAKGFTSEELLNLAFKYRLELDDFYFQLPQLLHGPVGARIIYEEFGIRDTEILNAVKYHSTGRPDMTLLEKIIFLADYIEPNRECSWLERLREMAFENLDRAIVKACEQTITYQIKRGDLIHPLTLATRNYYLRKDEADGGQKKG